jgi:hypothetical protein
MPDLTRRQYPERPDCWHVYYGDVHVGTISKCVGNPGAAEAWQWLCGFYPGSNPGDQRGGTASTFEQARAAFEAAWRVYLPIRGRFPGLARSARLDGGKVSPLRSWRADAAGLAGW